MRKALSVLLILMLIFGMTVSAFAAISNVTVDQSVKTISKGETASYVITITNDNGGNARETMLSLEGNAVIKEVSTFTPQIIDLSRNSSAQVTLTIDTETLTEVEYSFQVKAEAPEIQGRGNAGQSASSFISEEIILKVHAATDPDPDPEPDPEPEIPTTVHYVAIGDSLVTGSTGISGTMTSYVHGFFTHLQSVYGTDDVTRSILGSDGDTTGILLDKLMNDPAYISEVEKADIITLSIGGNNIMPAARDSSFWEIDEALAQSGPENFEEEYTQIMEQIYALNSDVTVIATTLYNPYNKSNQPRGYSGDTELHITAEKYINEVINTVIREYQNYTYHVVDTHGFFIENYGTSGKMGDVTFFYPRYVWYTWWYVQLTRDPHLNQRGQDEMLKLHIDVFNSEMSTMTNLSFQIAA